MHRGSVMGEFDAVQSVQDTMPSVFDMTDHGGPFRAFAEPCQNGVGVFTIDRQHHAHAHVEGPVHLSGLHGPRLLQPDKLRQHRQRCVNVPSKGGMQTKQVGQPTTGDVANTVNVMDAKCSISTRSVEQVDNRVAVNLGRIEHDLAQRCVALRPSNQGAVGMAGVERGNVGVLQSGVLNDLPYQGLPVGVNSR